jgi:hypothetical protein
MEEEFKEEEVTSEKPQEDLEKELEKELTSEEIRERNRQLLARTKKAEEKAKRMEAEKIVLEKELEKLKKDREEWIKRKEEEIPLAELVKKISALRDYSPEELDFISTISKAKNISLEEAARSEDVQLWIKARREKVAKESQPPPPTSKQIPEKKSFEEWTTEDVQKASFQELEEFRKWAKSQIKR